VKSDIFGIPLLSSLAVHIFVILITSVVFHANHLRRQDFLPIGLVYLPRPENPPPPKRFEMPPEAKKPAPAPAKLDPPKETRRIEQQSKLVAKVETPEPKTPAPLPAVPKPEPAKVAEPDLASPAQTAPQASLSSDSQIGFGGSEAGAGSPFGNGDAGVVPGTGSTGGGGIASSGFGQGGGAPGLAARTSPIKTTRQAKAIQIARASYPPMALRMGLESDVALKIEVDTEGKVTKAEITKSGGAGFDEEALNAVKRSRFEPAQRDGQHVPAEFTYIYRFRLRK
jgi:TonB family protein